MQLFDLLVMKMQGWWYRSIFFFGPYHSIWPRKEFRTKVKAVVAVDALFSWAVRRRRVLSMMSVSRGDIHVRIWSGRSCLRLGLCGGRRGKWGAIGFPLVQPHLATCPAPLPYYSKYRD